MMEKTINKFKKGTSYLNVVKAVGSNDLGKQEQVFDLSGLDIVKFIPASGAATRMFQNLYEYLETKEKTEFMNQFFGSIKEFPFYEELELSNLSEEEQVKKVLDTYGDKPKALIKVHKYLSTVTPIEEHISESLEYISKEDLHLHFTISENHEKWFNDYVKEIDEKVDITYSFQDPKTDTLAVDENNEPFVLENGEILYRAGGHGALIHNLNNIDADIIMIKNIDNVCHKSLLKDTVDSRKELINIGLFTQKRIFEYVRLLEENNDCDLNEVIDFIQNTLHVTLAKYDKETCLNVLKRPLRVCGVVKNEGEPGGGPFIIESNGISSPQIVEMKELNQEKDKEIISNAEYFNPVDLICFVKNSQNEKYDLLKYIDETRYFISEKSYKGRTLKALEHPGLWNGAMHNWNTIFVSVPLSTFNPIKTVNDLLRNGHTGK